PSDGARSSRLVIRDASPQRRESRMIMAIITLALKDLRLIARDTRAAVILLAMPLLFIVVLGLSLGEGFGQKPDDRLRISLVDEDAGLPPNPGPFPGEPWSLVVRRYLEQTA